MHQVYVNAFEFYIFCKTEGLDIHTYVFLKWSVTPLSLRYTFRDKTILFLFKLVSQFLSDLDKTWFRSAVHIRHMSNRQNCQNCQIS